MKKILFVAILLLIIVQVSLAAPGEHLLHDFESYNSSTIHDIIERNDNSRTDYTIDPAKAQSGKALRITLGGPEIESSYLSFPITGRNLSQYDGISLYICNDTGSAVNVGLHLMSRADNGNEYFLYFSSPCFFFISFCALQLCRMSAVQAKGTKTLDISVGVADGPQLHDRKLGF